MKKLLLITLLAASIFGGKVHAQNMAYVDPIYTRASITRTNNVMYADGYSVLKYPSIYIDTLRFDWYNPTTNSSTARPLIIMCPTGSFLPRYINKLPTGAKDDSATVEIATQFAMRGYVVAVISYRQGWNPKATFEKDRKNGIINAAYKGVQDLNAAIRFFKKSVKSDGNPYGIDTTKIVTGGQGTGGYITLTQATLSSQSDIKIDKFIDYSGLDSTPKKPVVTMVLDTFWGDRFGYKLVPTTPYCRENSKGHTSNVAVTFDFGGAIGDISWLDKGETPMICAHPIYDPFAPYKTGMVRVPGTSDNVVIVSGGYDVMKRADSLGNTSCFKGKVHDWYTMRANSINDNIDGLLPFAGATSASAPWEWWDTAKINLLPSPPFEPKTIIGNGNASNPLHKIYGKTRALTFIDTLVGYFAPRMAVCMGLQTSVGIKVADLASNVTVAPNPAKNQFYIHNNWTNNNLISASITDLNGKLIKQLTITGNHSLVTAELPTGLYLVQMQFTNGTGVKKLVIE